MNNLIKNLTKYTSKECLLFILGGIVYTIIELLWRGSSHWSMYIVGGICFVLIGLINEIFTFNMYIEVQAAISSVIVTVLEFLSGIVVNIWLGWNVWDYSHLPLNVMGQVCLLYTVLWFFLSYLGIYLDDLFRWYLFDESRPKYRSFIFEKCGKFFEKK